MLLYLLMSLLMLPLMSLSVLLLLLVLLFLTLMSLLLLFNIKTSITINPEDPSYKLFYSPCQTQEIGSNTHYLGQSEITAHFGLGFRSKNVTLVVRWPARNIHVKYVQVPPNTKLRIVRPEQ